MSFSSILSFADDPLSVVVPVRRPGRAATRPRHGTPTRCGDRQRARFLDRSCPKGSQRRIGNRPDRGAGIRSERDRSQAVLRKPRWPTAQARRSWAHLDAGWQLLSVTKRNAAERARRIPARARGVQLVYGGFSAGVVAVTPTLREITPRRPTGGDSSAQVYGPRSCGTGWRLCPTASRHTTTRHTPESELIDRAIEYFRNQSMPFKAIRDGEVIIITRAVTDRNLGP